MARRVVIEQGGNRSEIDKGIRNKWNWSWLEKDIDHHHHPYSILNQYADYFDALGW